jgi:hypothetical protein
MHLREEEEGKEENDVQEEREEGPSIQLGPLYFVDI